MDPPSRTGRMLSFHFMLQLGYSLYCIIMGRGTSVKYGREINK
jgi:hypothetical protein